MHRFLRLLTRVSSNLTNFCDCVWIKLRLRLAKANADYFQQKCSVSAVAGTLQISNLKRRLIENEQSNLNLTDNKAEHFWWLKFHILLNVSRTH